MFSKKNFRATVFFSLGCANIYIYINLQLAFIWDCAQNTGVCYRLPWWDIMGDTCGEGLYNIPESRCCSYCQQVFSSDVTVEMARACHASS